MKAHQSLRLSRFLREVTHKGLVAIFHQLHPEPVYVSENTWQEITARHITDTMRPVLTLLADRGLLVSSDEDERELQSVRMSTLRGLDRPTILYLMLAQGCNFACNYCPVPGLAARHGDSRMSLVDALSGIELWKRHIKDFQDDQPFYLIFYGGEPLLNRPVLEALLPLIAEQKERGELPQRLELMLCTNGALMDADIARLMKHHGVTVALGVDGPGDHNVWRVTTDGAATLPLIERAARLLIENEVSVVASVTLTPGNLPVAAGYAEFLRTLGISRFGFNLMKGKALLTALGGGSTADYYRAAARVVLAGLNATEGDPTEYQLQKKLDALLHGLPFSVDCTCYGNQLVIQADGQVTNCPFFRHDQGRVEALPQSFRIGETEVVRRWRQRLPIFGSNERLDACSVLDGGGCTWGSHDQTGNVDVADDGNALFNQEVTHGLIWHILPERARRELLSGEATSWDHRRLGSV